MLPAGRGTPRHDRGRDTDPPLIYPPQKNENVLVLFNQIHSVSYWLSNYIVTYPKFKHLKTQLWSPWLSRNIVFQRCRIQDASRQLQKPNNFIYFLGLSCQYSEYSTLQRHSNLNSKQIFLEKELWVLSPNFYIDVEFLWMFSIFPQLVCLFCCRKICIPILGIYKSLTDTWMLKLGLRPRNSFSGNK
jgi:hypothetical protein